MASFDEGFYRVRSYIQGKLRKDEVQFNLQKLKNFRDHKDHFGWTLLHHSVIYKNTEMIKYLIEWGCNVNVRGKCGNTPLMIATQIADTTSVELLLKSNADMYLKNNGESSFDLAAQHRLIDSTLAPLQHSRHHIFDMFVEKANEDFLMSAHDTVSSLLRVGNVVKLALVIHGSAELTSFLLENGYPADFCKTKNGFTALHWAVYLAKRETVKMLIHYGANVNFLDTKEHSPLYYYLEKLEAVDEQSEVLIALGTARLTTVNQHELPILQHEAEYLLKKGKKETVQTILKSGIEINSMNFSDGRSLLHVLIENKDDDVIDVLDELGIEFDVNALTESQETALMIAARFGFLRKVEFLLQRGANANLTGNNGESALFYACMLNRRDVKDGIQNRVAIVELLLQHGANVQISVYGATIFDSIHFVDLKISLGKVIMAHLALQEAIDHLPLTSLIREKIDSKLIYKTQYDVCVQEIEEMKNIEVHKKISLFDLLIEKSEKKMSRYVQDETFASAFYSSIKKISSDSYYFKILEKGIKRVIDKFELDKKAAPVLGTLTGMCCDVYHHVIYQIISYLDDHDLHNVCQLRAYYCK